MCVVETERTDFMKPPRGEVQDVARCEVRVHRSDALREREAWIVEAHPLLINGAPAVRFVVWVTRSLRLWQVHVLDVARVDDVHSLIAVEVENEVMAPVVLMYATWYETQSDRDDERERSPMRDARCRMCCANEATRRGQLVHESVFLFFACAGVGAEMTRRVVTGRYLPSAHRCLRRLSSTLVCA